MMSKKDNISEAKESLISSPKLYNTRNKVDK